jgi:hypothetical protein
VKLGNIPAVSATHYYYYLCSKEDLSVFHSPVKEADAEEWPPLPMLGVDSEYSWQPRSHLLVGGCGTIWSFIEERYKLSR